MISRLARPLPSPVLLITALALAIRLGLVLAFAEAPGDGPTRAIMGYHWHLTGHVSFYAHWLQGHQVMIGLLLWLVPEPAWAGRILSLLCGTLAVPLLAWTTGRLFGPKAAILAAAALALNPMHAALSATSLSEPVALTALLGMVAATLRLGDRPNEALAWAGLALAALVGTSVRFEVWLALPVLALHHLLRRRSPWRAGLLALATLPFPLLWMANRLQIGGLAKAYGGTTGGAAALGADPLGLAGGAASFAGALQTITGGPLLWLALIGVLGFAAARAGAGPAGDDPAGDPARRWRLDLAAYLGVVAGQTLFLVKFAADMGAALWPRYLAMEAVLLLPLAAHAVAACLQPRAVRDAAALAAVGAMLFTAWDGRSSFYLVRRVPEDARVAARWLGERPRAEAFLLTRMSWQSSYLPVLARLSPDRYQIVSNWIPDERLKIFTRDRRPALVVTRDGDAELLDRVCRVTGLRGRTDAPVARFGKLVVLPLVDGECATEAAVAGVKPGA